MVIKKERKKEERTLPLTRRTQVPCSQSHRDTDSTLEPCRQPLLLHRQGAQLPRVSSGSGGSWYPGSRVCNSSRPRSGPGRSLDITSHRTPALLRCHPTLDTRRRPLPRPGQVAEHTSHTLWEDTNLLFKFLLKNFRLIVVDFVIH